MPGVKQPCPMVAACWSPAMPQMRIAPPNRSGRVSPKSAAQSRTSGSSAAGMREQLAAGPGPRRRGAISNSSVRDALVASVAWTLPPVSRQSRNESTVPNASRPCSAAARAPVHMVEQPADLGRREIRIEHQAGLVRDRGLMAGGAQRRAGVGGAPVLPDDGVVDRLAVDAIPDDRGLALVGDADAGDVLGADAGLGHRLAHGRDHGRPDFLRIVLDPSRRRIDLAQLLLRDRDRRELGVEHDRPRRGGALVDGDEVGRHGADADAFYRPPERGTSA